MIKTDFLGLIFPSGQKENELRFLECILVSPLTLKSFFSPSPSEWSAEEALAELDAAQKKWEAAGISDYAYHMVIFPPRSHYFPFMEKVLGK